LRFCKRKIAFQKGTHRNHGLFLPFFAEIIGLKLQNPVNFSQNFVGNLQARPPSPAQFVRFSQIFQKNEILPYFRSRTSVFSKETQKTEAPKGYFSRWTMDFPGKIPACPAGGRGQD